MKTKVIETKTDYFVVVETDFGFIVLDTIQIDRTVYDDIKHARKATYARSAERAYTDSKPDC